MSAFDKHYYRQACAFEETANLCWQLIAALEDHFVGYEDLVSSLRDTAIRLEVEFDAAARIMECSDILSNLEDK